MKPYSTPLVPTPVPLWLSTPAPLWVPTPVPLWEPTPAIFGPSKLSTREVGLSLQCLCVLKQCAEGLVIVKVEMGRRLAQAGLHQPWSCPKLGVNR